MREREREDRGGSPVARDYKSPARLGLVLGPVDSNFNELDPVRSSSKGRLRFRLPWHKIYPVLSSFPIRFPLH